MLHEWVLIGGSVWSLIALGLLGWAWLAARAGAFRRHAGLMTFLIVAAWVFAALYLLHFRFPSLLPPVPAQLLPWIYVHGSIGMLPLVLGPLLIWARRRPAAGLAAAVNRRHRLLGRIAVAAWVFTHLGGLWNAWYFLQ